MQNYIVFVISVCFSLRIHRLEWRLYPENLNGANLDAVGYHRRCYQRFTKYLDRLKYELGPRALELGENNLHRRVMGEDLFA